MPSGQKADIYVDETASMQTANTGVPHLSQADIRSSETVLFGARVEYDELTRNNAVLRREQCEIVCANVGLRKEKPDLFAANASLRVEKAALETTIQKLTENFADLRGRGDMEAEEQKSEPVQLPLSLVYVTDKWVNDAHKKVAKASPEGDRNPL
ncbi:hypothetical protein EDC01DRAFT_630778 [Geopyxis carbonaria]|nr:hypothetical protein EDC01DRAFT_630778 [Geopyxis carbonaria]